jgi:membrane protein implicated in regulation of membrane protease activity
MWIITGVLLGLVCLATVFGFHAGPHAHGVAGALGVFAGGCLVYLLIEHGSGPGLWSVLGVDLLSSAGLAVLGWKGVSEYKEEVLADHRHPLEGVEGVAVSDLVPDGIIRIRGEEWSAISVNGSARRDTRVQVLRATGVRLEVWSEEAERQSSEGLFQLAEFVREER